MRAMQTSPPFATTLAAALSIFGAVPVAAEPTTSTTPSDAATFLGGKLSVGVRDHLGQCIVASTYANLAGRAPAPYLIQAFDEHASMTRPAPADPRLRIAIRVARAGSPAPDLANAKQLGSALHQSFMNCLMLSGLQYRYTNDVEVHLEVEREQDWFEQQARALLRIEAASEDGKTGMSYALTKSGALVPVRP